MTSSKELWTNLHKESRYRPKYPSETVVQYVFRNFERCGSEKCWIWDVVPEGIFFLWLQKELFRMD